MAKAKEINKADINGSTHRVMLPERTPLNEVIAYLSIGNIVKVALAIAVVYYGFQMLFILKDKLVLMILAIFVATIMDPGVEALKRMGIPRGLGVLLHYLIAVCLIVFLLISLIPIIADQIQAIAGLLNARANAFLQHPQINLPFVNAATNQQMTVFIESTLKSLNITRFTDALGQISQNLNTVAQGSLIFAAQIAGSVFDFVSKAVIVFVLAFFIQVEKTKIITWVRGFISSDYKGYATDKAEVIHFKLAQWARGQLTLCLVLGFLVFLALTILRMPYALTLAILAGFTEFIPVIGPLIAAVPAVLIATTEGGFIWGLVIILVYYVIQWCENNLLVPLIMKRAVGLSPIAIIFAMLVGISFPIFIHPLLGIMLAIPTTTIVALFLEDLRELRTRKRVEPTA
ncbi:MAG: hypothetical protein JWM56_585 [Candidatus Peribacteria bacterium]|nr:hypothetical protein [Candidatus Peribacteria bacterium]